MFHRTGESKIGLPCEMRSLFLWGNPPILIHIFVTHAILQMVEFTVLMSQRDGKITLKQSDIYNFSKFS
jgi:hypothetical protein